METYSCVVFVVFFLFVLKKCMDLRELLSVTRHRPRLLALFPSTGLAGFILEKPIPLLALGGARNIHAKYADFQRLGLDIISTVSIFPKVSSTTLVADATTIRHITSNRFLFPKPVHQYKTLGFFGRNLVVSEGDEWKRFRKISAPAFSEPNNRLVWDSTIRIMLDLFDNQWEGKDEIAFDHAIELTLPIALFVIGVAGFGKPVSWSEDLSVAPGHHMSFKESLQIVSSGVFIKAFLPKWLLDWAPTRRIKNVKTAYDELEKYMMEMVHARRISQGKTEKHDLFTSLLDANEDEDDERAKLSDDELLGNIFIFLLAGHETTAHTLCFTFALLALHQDYQERLYQQIISILPDGRTPTYDEMGLFTEALAYAAPLPSPGILIDTSPAYSTKRCASSRLYVVSSLESSNADAPQGPGVPKVATADTVLTTTSPGTGATTTVPIARGTNIILNIAALHYNPRYWPDPYAFRPERFLDGTWPRDAFLPFSAGARACLGRRFFETEGIAVLVMLVARFRVELGEGVEREEVLRFRRGITTTPVKVPLVFKRRHFSQVRT